jgi:hypothetical protein
MNNDTNIYFCMVRNTYKLFKIDNICSLVEKFYPLDFIEQEKIQLQHYKHDVPRYPDLQNLSTSYMTYVKHW